MNDNFDYNDNDEYDDYEKRLSTIEEAFKKLITMEDKNKASRTVVRNAIKFVEENGWNSDGWSDGERVCLVGALLQGAGVDVQEDSEFAEACVVDPKSGKRCQRDELLFKSLPPLKEATKTVLNKWLGEMITEFKVQVKENEKTGDLDYEYEYDVDDVESRLETAQDARLAKTAAALRVSQAIQQFNDGVLDDEDKAVDFLKDLLKAIPTKAGTVKVTNSKDLK